jgi:hypothetical protein
MRRSSRTRPRESEALRHMTIGRRPFMTARAIRILDVTLVVWIVLWILLAVFVGRAIWSVGRIADPVISNAGGLSETAQGFERLRSVPLIGGVLGGAVGGVAGAADKSRAEAQAIKDRIHTVGLVVGILIAAGPVLVALLIYLPVRLPWRRDVAAVRAALARDPRDPVLQRYLAERAILGLAYDELRELSDDPWSDMRTGRAEALALVELTRLGLAPSQ